VEQHGARQSTHALVGWAILLAAVFLGAVSLAVIWLVAVPTGPEVCAAVMPPARNCFSGDRVSKAVITTIILAAVLIATVVAAWLMASGRRFAGAVAVIGAIALAVAPFTAYLWVAWIPALA